MYPSETLHFNHAVLALYQDEKNDLFIGTWGYGLIKFDRTGNEFIYCFERLGAGNSQTKHRSSFLAYCRTYMAIYGLEHVTTGFTR